MQRIIEIVLTAVALAMFAVGLYIRFTHPALSETQLFVDFWWYWLAVFGVGVVALLALKKSRS